MQVMALGFHLFGYLGLNNLQPKSDPSSGELGLAQLLMKGENNFSNYASVLGSWTNRLIASGGGTRS